MNYSSRKKNRWVDFKKKRWENKMKKNMKLLDGRSNLQRKRQQIEMDGELGVKWNGPRSLMTKKKKNEYCLNIFSYCTAICIHYNANL